MRASRNYSKSKWVSQALLEVNYRARKNRSKPIASTAVASGDGIAHLPVARASPNPGLGRRYLGTAHRGTRSRAILGQNQRAESWRRRCGERQNSKIVQQALVIVMPTDPKPRDRISGHQAERAMRNTDANRIDGLGAIHTFELKCGISWVSLKLPIAASSVFLHIHRQRIEQTPEFSGCLRLHRGRAAGSNSTTSPCEISARAWSTRPLTTKSERGSCNR